MQVLVADVLYSVACYPLKSAHVSDKRKFVDGHNILQGSSGSSALKVHTCRVSKDCIGNSAMLLSTLLCTLQEMIVALAVSVRKAHVNCWLIS